MRRYGAHSFIWFAVLFSVFSLILPTGASCADEPASLQVVRITPTGKDVPPGRQVVFQFDRAVVPVGRMARNAAEIPIAIAPVLDCQWRWLNTSALACQLDEKSSLSPATHYRITINPGLQIRRRCNPGRSPCGTTLPPSVPQFDMPGLEPGRLPVCP